jgi:hypothetical protein
VPFQNLSCGGFDGRAWYNAFHQDEKHPIVSADPCAAGDDVTCEDVQQAFADLSPAYKILSASEKALIARALQPASDQLGSDNSMSLRADALQVLRAAAAAAVVEPVATESATEQADNQDDSDITASSTELAEAEQSLVGSGASATAAELEKLAEIVHDDSMTAAEIEDSAKALLDGSNSGDAALRDDLGKAALHFLRDYKQRCTRHVRGLPESILYRVTSELSGTLSTAVSAKQHASNVGALLRWHNASHYCHMQVRRR